MTMADRDRPQRGGQACHHPLEDVFAMLVGCFLVSVGLHFYSLGHLLTGGAAGLAFLLHYATGISFPWLFLALNAPFFLLAISRMGWMMAARSVCAVAFVSVLTRWTPEWVGIDRMIPCYSAVMGATLIGVGLLVLLRHHTGLGGLGLLAMFIQERFGIPVGKAQLIMDVMIALTSLLVLHWSQVAWSCLGMVIMNVIIWVNHRANRYIGMTSPLG